MAVILSLVWGRRAPGFLIATVASACLTSAGCGLQDYEARMETQQNRLRYLELQNQNLEPYKLQLPDRKPEDDLAKEEFFMRPPKGISGDGDDKIIGSDIAHFPANGGTPIRDVWVAAVKRDNDKKFQKDVLELLKINARKVQTKTVGGVGMPQLPFDWIHDDQGAKGIFDAYFYKKSPFLAAIVFRTEGNKENAVTTPPQIDYALASLRLGSEAKAQRLGKSNATSFKTTKPPK
ncbi:MAG TPA: hypothetical protein VGP68_21485 [Gemmataceae bacterium]|nr:hypothetical protein [Gemmataceae bacterium]